ncbi:MAG: hypothetical protein Q8K63_09400 [Acidimicrobiales bacterium]|nr:hypothetical protein [Acidimicrobiales bacterium]
MTYSLPYVEAAVSMHARGDTVLQIAKALGISRASVRGWIANPSERRERLAHSASHASSECSLISALPEAEYAYLLGQYLGDGCISAMGPRGVFRLRIATCDDYPVIRQQTVDAEKAVMPQNKVGVAPSIGCAEVNSYSKHWPCLFPQHGPGRKHERDIVLEDWQQDIVESYPREFLTGLVHSDGCRAVNKIKKKNGKVYEYPRYFFSNVSDDIIGIFTNTCDQLGVDWKQNRWNSISVARSEDVAYLDTFIGPKT